MIIDRNNRLLCKYSLAFKASYSNSPESSTFEASRLLSSRAQLCARGLSRGPRPTCQVTRSENTAKSLPYTLRV